MHRRYSLFLLAMLVTACLTGCERDSNLKNMPDYELSQRHSKCQDRQPTAPGQVQACENIRRECDRRREELGTFVCVNH